MHAITLPKPTPITLRAGKTAVLVLDGSVRWGNPELPCHQLVPGMKRFLDRAREAGLPIIYTVSYRRKGTPEGQVYSGLARKASEPVIYPDSFDKFAGRLSLQVRTDRNQRSTLCYTLPVINQGVPDYRACVRFA